MSTPNNLRTVSRIVTTFSKDGKSVFDSTFPPSPPSRTFTGDMSVSMCYATTNFPIRLSDNSDLQTYQHYIENPPPIVIPNGCAVKLVDFPPGYESPMHRSVSLNYNFVIEGEVEVELDSGEKRLFRRGDCLVQRAVNHLWRNASDTEWARITAISLEVEPFEVGEQVVGEVGGSLDFN